jgi:hypothetical protein
MPISAIMGYRKSGEGGPHGPRYTAKFKPGEDCGGDTGDDERVFL